MSLISAGSISLDSTFNVDAKVQLKIKTSREANLNPEGKTSSQGCSQVVAKVEGHIFKNCIFRLLLDCCILLLVLFNQLLNCFRKNLIIFMQFILLGPL